MKVSDLNKHIEKPNDKITEMTGILLEDAKVDKDSASTGNDTYVKCLKVSEVSAEEAKKVRDAHRDFSTAVAGAASVLAATAMKADKGLESFALKASAGGSSNSVNANVRREAHYRNLNSKDAANPTVTKHGVITLSVKSGYKGQEFNKVKEASSALIKGLK